MSVEQATIGEQFSALMDEMDAAYASRAQHRLRSPGWIAADVMVERAYAKLRVLNAQVKA